jgi:hypothetical protein
VSTTIKTINTGVLSIAYLEYGPASGWPCILGHGFPYDAHAYDQAAPILAQGWGANDRPLSARLWANAVPSREQIQRPARTSHIQGRRPQPAAGASGGMGAAVIDARKMANA